MELILVTCMPQKRGSDPRVLAPTAVIDGGERRETPRREARHVTRIGGPVGTDACAAGTSPARARRHSGRVEGTGGMNAGMNMPGCRRVIQLCAAGSVWTWEDGRRNDGASAQRLGQRPMRADTGVLG